MPARRQRRQQVGRLGAPAGKLRLGYAGLIEGHQGQTPQRRIGVCRCRPSGYEICRGSGDGAQATGKFVREAEPTRPAVAASAPLQLPIRCVEDRRADGGGALSLHLRRWAGLGRDGRLKQGDQRGQLFPRRRPDNIEVDIEIRMDQPVAHSDDPLTTVSPANSVAWVP